MTANRLAVCEDLLANVFSLIDGFKGCECILAGDFNTNLDVTSPCCVCVCACCLFDLLCVLPYHYVWRIKFNILL